MQHHTVERVEAEHLLESVSNMPRGFHTRSISTHLACFGVNVNDQLSIEQCLPERIIVSLPVWEMQIPDPEEPLFPVDLSHRSATHISLLCGSLTNQTSCSSVIPLKTIKTSTPNTIIFSQTQKSFFSSKSRLAALNEIGCDPGNLLSDVPQARPHEKRESVGSAGRSRVLLDIGDWVTRHLARGRSAGQYNPSLAEGWSSLSAPGGGNKSRIWFRAVQTRCLGGVEVDR